MQLVLPDSPGGWHRRIWSLSWPVVTANITIPLVGLVDIAVMGRMPEPAYVGAVAVGATIFNALYWIFGFLRMGTTGLAAQAAGARDADELRAVASRAQWLAVAIGGAAVALQLPMRAAVMWAFDASAEVETLAGNYFLIRIWGAPALMIHMVVLGVLFGTQRMRATLALSVLLNLTNVGLDLLFVLGFGWGVEGVALATVISEWLAAVTGLWLINRQLGGLRADRALWQGHQASRLFRVSGNLIVRSFFVQLPFFVFTLVGASLGDLVLAANAIIMQLFITMAFALDGPAHTAETLCGFAYGAGNRRGFADATRYSLIWAVLLAIAMAVIFALGGEAFIALLTRLPQVHEEARALLPWAVAGPLIAVWAFHFDGVFIGTTQTATLRNSMIIAALVYLAALWLGLEALGNTALWLAMMIFMAVRGLILAVLYPGISRKLARSGQG